MTHVEQDLADMVIQSGAKSLAVIGTAKNVGKTVTMNYLVSEMYAKGITLGLVSSGRDGEIVDALTGDPKPSVVPPKGSWIATAEGVIGEAEMYLEVADVFERAGIFGRIIIGRMLESVPIELVGPQTAKELSLIVKKLQAFGADIVLVDGALDRKAAASPQVTDATILCTGAAAGRSLEAVAQEIGFMVWLMSRPQPEDDRILLLAREATDRERVCFVDACSYGFVLRPTNYVTVLGNEDVILEELEEGENPVAVVVPGAVNQEFLDGVSAWAENDEFSVISRDPVSIFIDKKPQVNLYVVEPILLLGVTVNPGSYADVYWDPKEMVSEVAREISKWGYALPVFDVVSGEKTVSEGQGLAVG